MITQDTANELLRQLIAVSTQINATVGVTPPGIQAAIEKATLEKEDDVRRT